MPLLGPNNEGRNQVFQELKPVCVNLSQKLLALNTSQGSIQDVTESLERLHKCLLTVTKNPYSLDEKLAEYIFFPLSQLLKISHKASIRCLELALQCLSILVDQGWRGQIQPQLAAQVVILCTLLADSNPKGLATADTTDELRASSYRCLYHVFCAAALSEESRKALISQANFAQLGQTITTILDGIVDGGSSEVQMAAVDALRALIDRVATQEIHAAFLPGIISKLTKTIAPVVGQRRNHKVIIGSINCASTLLRSTLSDDSIASKEQMDGAIGAYVAGNRNANITEEWLETAATQLKPALSSITRVKTSDRHDVQRALANLCLVVLQDCSTTLRNCAELAMVALLYLASQEQGDEIKSRLGTGIDVNPRIEDLVLDSIYNHATRLSTLMHSNDEDVKTQSIAQITTAYKIYIARKGTSAVLDQRIMTALRDSAVILLSNSKIHHTGEVSVVPVRATNLLISHDRERSLNFAPVLGDERGSHRTFAAINACANTVSKSSFATSSNDMMRSLGLVHGDAEIVDMWLLVETIRAAVVNTRATMMFVPGNASDISVLRGRLEQIYSYSLDLLNADVDDQVDPRLQSLAVQAIALRAQVEGRDFRYEMIDALFPVLNFLASPEERLQRDGITALNIFTQACEYTSVRELIVDNVDYLTNAVSLKLNAFNIGPQAPQVLLMMLRLAGPDLLPFLEDSVDSIFAALENYHGYPLLVELLFRVLSVLAEEGVKNSKLAIEAGDAMHDVRQVEQHSMTMNELLASVRVNALSDDVAIEAEIDIIEPTPQEPWKRSKAMSADVDGEGEHEEDSPPPDEIVIPPPARKTYALLLKVTELTQHYLTSASPSLRVSLLSLIRTTAPALAKHEDSFLPLINTLWPEITSRLDDSEMHVVSAALEIIAVLCETAGNFMHSRIVQLWPRLTEVYAHLTKDMVTSHRSNVATTFGNRELVLKDSDILSRAVARMQSMPADYSDTGTRLVWTSLVHVLTAIMRTIEVNAEMFDDVLRMLQPALSNTEVLKVLNDVNSDAVWLACVRTGAISLPSSSMSGDAAGLASFRVELMT